MFCKPGWILCLVLQWTPVDQIDLLFILGLIKYFAIFYSGRTGNAL